MNQPEQKPSLMTPSNHLQSHDNLICVARIIRPQGIRGEVIADLLTDFPERFGSLKTVRVIDAEGKFLLLTLEASRLHHQRIALKFADCHSVEQAEVLRNARVMIEKSELVALPADTWYEFDLIGCEVLTTGGNVIGEVTGVEDYGAAPLLRIQSRAGQPQREMLIPLALDICIEVDPTSKRIVIDPPAGLLEL